MMDGAGRMKQIGEAATKAARHRKFHWCRRPNGFSDMPMWGVVADKLGLPLYQVLAFANRLEELGNAAANFGEIRGNLSRFSSIEFAKALGMSAEDVARIYAALEHPDIGWIAYDHIADFYDRNPDKEDEGAAERKRRQRLRESIRRQLAKLSMLGKIDESERRAIEEALGGAEAELRNLQAKLSQAELRDELSTAGHVTRDGRDTRVDVTRDGRDIHPQLKNAFQELQNAVPGSEKKLSTTDPVTRDGRMSQCDIVTVTPEQSKDLRAGGLDNFGDGSGSEGSGLATGQVAEATIWLVSSGRQMLIDFMQIRPALAETYLERWRRDIQDDAALVAIIQGAEQAGYIGARFHTIITEQLKRHVARVQHGPQLPLMPPRPQTLKRSAS
jgi:hypothetical protein